MLGDGVMAKLGLKKRRRSWAHWGLNDWSFRSQLIFEAQAAQQSLYKNYNRCSIHSVEHKSGMSHRRPYGPLLRGRTCHHSVGLGDIESLLSQST